MKKTRRKQSNSNPTLTELLEPYLRDPPSPPPPSPPQSLPPLRSASSHNTVQRDPMKPWGRFHTPPPQFYHVHPCDFRALVQRLTGANAASTHEEIQVQSDQNVARIENEMTLPDIGASYLDASEILMPRTMGFIGDNRREEDNGEDNGESSGMGSFYR